MTGEKQPRAESEIRIVQPKERLKDFGNKVIEAMATIPNPAIPMPPRSSKKSKN